MSAPNVLILTAPGTNRQRDVADAFQHVGGQPTIASMHALRTQPSLLDSAQIVVLAGGFSYGDALGAGTVWATEVKAGFADQLRAFVAAGKPVLGICNGFQTLVRTGLLPGSLGHNADGRFVCRWVTLQPSAQTNSIWTRSITEPIDCPVAHGEGRYVAEPAVATNHAALRYVEGTNPNGSVDDIAGVSDSTGLVLGLMPHPENHIASKQHPRSHRGFVGRLGLPLFAAGVAHVANN